MNEGKSPGISLLNRNTLSIGIGSVLYFSWFIFAVGLRTEHVLLFFLLFTLYLLGGTFRQFLFAFFAFIIYWIIYDSMRVYPNYQVNPVHLFEPYKYEKAIFGVWDGGNLVTLNEYFKVHHRSIIDIISGFFYLNWVPIPLIFGFYLFRYHKIHFLKFSYAFLFVNILGFCIYYLYPAAPPWYIEQYGFSLHLHTPGNAAGLANFDQLTGLQIFSKMYAKNANVFAAMPSLHSAYPLLCLLYGRMFRSVWLNLGFSIFTAGIWFAAVYTRHHYLIDVIAGGAVAIGGYFIFEWLFKKYLNERFFQKLLPHI